MQEARIDKNGCLLVFRKGQTSPIEASYRVSGHNHSYDGAFSQCAHDCPGWEESNPRDEIKQNDVGENYIERHPQSVTLKCMPGEPTYEIVKDERGE